MPSSLRRPLGTPRSSAFILRFPAGGSFGSPGPGSPYSPAPTGCPLSCPWIGLIALPEPLACTHSSNPRAPTRPWGSDAPPAIGGSAQTLTLHLCLGCIQRLPAPDPLPCGQGLSTLFVSSPLLLEVGSPDSGFFIRLERIRAVE